MNPLKEFVRKYGIIAGGICLVCGLVFSPAMQSIGIGILFFSSLFFSGEGDVRNRITALIKNPYALVFIVSFFLSLISYFYSENYAEFWNKIIVKLPFVLLPFALAYPGILKRNHIKIISFIFCSAVVLAGLISLGNYIINFSQINEEILHSKPIPIMFGKTNHIYYSVMLAFSFWLCIYNVNKYNIKNNYFLYSGYIYAFIILVLLHTIASRTGLISFYVSCAFALLWWMIKYKKILAGLGVITLSIILGLSAVFFVPSLHNRFINTVEDLNKVKEHQNPNYYSIAMRKEAATTAWKIAKKNIILGVGEGDLNNEMQAQYEAQKTILLPENRKLPHNQFLQTLCTTGVAGLLVLLCLFALPFIEQNTFNNPLLLCFIIIYIIALQMESMLERQAGISLFVFFLLILPYHNLSYEKEEANLSPLPQ